MSGGQTVGIVLVSHSAALAEGAAAVASQISGGIVTVAGVVVVPDLGSSVLTVRALLAEPDDQTPGQVVLADAPFVEGAVAATVTAAAGGDVTAVLAAAEEARHARKL